MKTKPILISAAIVVLIAIAIFLVAHYKKSSRPEIVEINQFLYNFNNQVDQGNTDSLLSYFEAGKKLTALKQLVNLIAGKKTFSGDKPTAAIKFNIDASDVKIIDEETAIATLPVKFSHEQLDTRSSELILRIRKTAPHKYKIIQVDARQFLADYIVYENFVKSTTLTDKDIYSPITLEAFATAAQLKAKYDSVVWFAHFNQKNYFYVVKGKWETYYDGHPNDTTKQCKMGLVGPDLKEIIPVEFDLIHNISATFENLIEVEKNHKRGFYDLNGKVILPVVYDQIFPVSDGINLAALKNGNDFFWLKNDYTVSEKVDLKMADIVANLKQSSSFTLPDSTSENITEFNSRVLHGSIYIPPSYLVDINLLPAVKIFKNRLRKNVEFEEVSKSYIVKTDGQPIETNNWLQATFYSIRDYFLGGRSEFYDRKNLVIIDKKRNSVFSTDIITDYSPDGGETLEGPCNISSIRIISDSLFEVRAGAVLYTELYDSTKSIDGGIYYHYLTIKNNKLIELPNYRTFGFTKYVKMDDSYLNGCYNLSTGTEPMNLKKVTIDHLTPEILRYMKNEIYADYAYQFKDKRWEAVFEEMGSYDRHKKYDKQGGYEKSNNINVDDSLTVIDKYNLNWINNKLKQLQKPATRTLASK